MYWRTNNGDSTREPLLGSGQEPPLASHLVTPRMFYSHHGIYIGNGRVIHYRGLAHGLRRGPVEDVSLNNFGRGRSIRIRSEQPRFDRPEVVERARSRLGEHSYRILTNNCEHLCAWALCDENRSSQIERLYAAALPLLAGVERHLRAIARPVFWLDSPNMTARSFWLATILVSALCAVASASAEEKSMQQRTAISTVSLPVEGKLPSLERASTWLNSQALSDADLRGRVVLVDFWTYTCINWLRTLPYVRAWAEKYKDQGLVVIGVHTPEFSFERDVENVRRAAKQQKVDYPIAIDSDYALWNAFGNRYWPALYFVDAHGRIRHHRFGEGDYDRSEAIIQQLLAEAGHTSVDRRLVSVNGRDAEAAADWNSLKSPETYVGHGRADSFAFSSEVRSEQPRVYAAASRLRLNQWALSGDWTIKSESAALNKANGTISYRFHARDLHLVMSPGMNGTPVRFRVLLDGQPVGASRGVDVDGQGFGRVVAPRMYQLIRQEVPIEDRQFEIEFLEPGVEVFVFTFG
jgi:thiol-disulfide isomerase/thioredoxin